MGGGVLLPQQLQGDALALEFLMQMREVRGGIAFQHRRGVGEQQRLQPRLVHVRGERPAETGVALHVLRYRPFRNLGGGSNPFVAKTGLELQT